MVSGGSLAGPLLQQTRTIPVVFTLTPDPVGAGFVTSLARPGGNATGFTSTEYGMSGKWLELLKEIAPRVTRAAVLRDPAIAQGIGQFAVMQSAGPPLGVELSPVTVRDASEIERAITEFARSSNGGMIVPASGLALLHRDLIISLAVRHKLPAVYFLRVFVRGGGLISYGADSIDPHRRAAGYVNRILKGEKTADLPVQNPTKYELVINLKTAKALGLTVPPTLLRAPTVIEVAVQLAASAHSTCADSDMGVTWRRHDQADARCQYIASRRCLGWRAPDIAGQRRGMDWARMTQLRHGWPICCAAQRPLGRRRGPRTQDGPKALVLVASARFVCSLAR